MHDPQDDPIPLGERAVKCISDAIAYLERHKGRARLKQHKPNRVLSPRRIEQDIKSVVSNLQPPQTDLTNPKNLVDCLQSLSAKARIDALAHDDIPDLIWAALGIDDPDTTSALLDAQSELVERFDKLAEDVVNSVSFTVYEARGRKPDPMLRPFLVQLAYIYKEYSGFRATATEHKDGSGMGSPFFTFVVTILHHFDHNPTFQKWLEHSGTLNGAIREVASLEGANDVDPDELSYLYEDRLEASKTDEDHPGIISYFRCVEGDLSFSLHEQIPDTSTRHRRRPI